MLVFSRITPLLTLLALGCGGVNQPVDSADAKGGAADAKSTDDDTEAASTTDEGQCSIPAGLTPGAPALGMPQVVAPDSIKVERASAMLELGDDGTVEVSFEINARNSGDAEATVTAGFVWRIQETGPGKVTSLSELQIRMGDAVLETCSIEGPSEAQQPYHDQALYSAVEMAAGGRLVIKGSYTAQIIQSDKPQTLFGFRDRFGNNWKNWDWPYTKSKVYAEIAEELKPFHGSFALGPASRTQVTIRGHGGENWFRALSHEQYVEKLRMAGAYRWSFWGGDPPAQVEFEYVVGLPLDREIKTFRGIVRENRFDLRARIRLADLAGFAGDPDARADIILGLLKVWKRAAKEQLLVDSNDVRGPAYVALVKSLKAAGRDKEAAQQTQAGIELLRKLAAKGEIAKMNEAALSWLETQ